MQTLNGDIYAPDSLVFDSQGHLWVVNNDFFGTGVEEFSASGLLIQTLTHGISLPQSLIFDFQGHLWVANQQTYDSSGNIINKSNVEAFSVSGVLMQTLSDGIDSSTSLVFDSQGNIWLGNDHSLKEFSTSKLSQSDTYQSTQITVTETAQNLTVNPNSSVNNPTLFNAIHSGD